jgi:hypothetical protein
VRIFLFIALFISKLFAQTTVFAVTSEGVADKNKYCIFKYGKFTVCDNCKEVPKDSASFEEFRTVVFFDDHITIQLERPTGPQNMHMIFGYLTEENKVLFAKVEKKESVVNISFEPSSEELKEAPYIYDKKVFDSSGNIIAIIEGEAKYGAAWYLLTSKR